MRKLDLVNGFAVLGTLVVLIGIFAAAGDALAGSNAPEAAEQTRLPARSVDKDAAERQTAMAERSMASLQEALRLDLDIQLGNHISTVRAEKQ